MGEELGWGVGGGAHGVGAGGGGAPGGSHGAQLASIPQPTSQPPTHK